MTTTATRQAVPSRHRTSPPSAPAWPFPVVVVRPATAAMPAYLGRACVWRGAANRLAAALTNQCRAGLGPGRLLRGGRWVDLDDPRSYLPHLPGRESVREIIRDAHGLAACPPPGAVRIGRDPRGRPVVAVLHAPRWSLVLRHGAPRPAVWAFLAATGRAGLRLHGTGELGLAWEQMTSDVYTTLIGDTG